MTADAPRGGNRERDAGVVVSNHGGRQLDRSVATAEALPEVVDAVEGRLPVYVDGGIRRGIDAAIALALCGCASPAALGRAHLRRAPAGSLYSS